MAQALTATTRQASTCALLYSTSFVLATCKLVWKKWSPPLNLRQIIVKLYAIVAKKA